MFSAGQIRGRARLLSHEMRLAESVAQARPDLRLPNTVFLTGPDFPSVEQLFVAPPQITDAFTIHGQPLPPFNLPRLPLFHDNAAMLDSVAVCEEPPLDQPMSLLPANESVPTDGNDGSMRDVLSKGALMLMSPALAGFMPPMEGAGGGAPSDLSLALIFSGMIFVSLFAAALFLRQSRRERHIDSVAETVLRTAFITMFTEGQRSRPEPAPSPVSASREAAAVAGDLVEGLQTAFEAPISPAPVSASSSAPESAPAPASQPEWKSPKRFKHLEYDDVPAPESAPSSSSAD